MAIQHVKDELKLIQTAGDTYIGNEIDQTYIVNPNIIKAGDTITIIDKGGTNKIQLVQGVEIVKSVVVANETELTLSNGAVINVRGADSFTFDIGGDAINGVEGVEKDFHAFATEVLGTPLPAEGEAPVITEPNVVVDEGGTVTKISDIQLTEIAPEPENTEVPAGTVIATISNFDANVTYTLEGDDASLYELNSETGEIVVKEAYTPDYETKDAYNFTIKAVDANGNELASQDITVPVKDIDPEFSIEIGEVTPEPENTEVPAGTVIATISNFDANVTYTLEGDDASLYELNSETGEIVVKEAYTPDYETKDAYNFTIKAVDANGNELASQDITVPVKDIDPEFSIEIGEVTPEPENTEVPAGTVIATISNFDANVTYTLEGDDASLYELNSETGEIVVKEAYTPDYETKDAYNFTIKAVDANGNELASQDITVPVEDIPNEGDVLELTNESGEKVIGTDLDDTFNGIVSSLTDERTLDSTDTIDGGAGNDTLNVTLETSFSGFSEENAVVNVENISIINDSNITRTFDATGIVGATKYSVDAVNGSVTLEDLDSIADIELSNQYSGSFDTKFATGVTDGTSDDISLTLSSVGVIDNPDTEDSEEELVDINIDGIESITLVANGDSAVNINDDALTTLGIEGSANSKLVIDEDVETLKEIDATNATGNLDIDASVASLDKAIMGSGDDTLIVDTSKTALNATITGGDGEDIVVFTGGGNTTQYSMSGMESVKLSDISASSDTTFSASNIEGIQNIDLDSTVESDVSFVNMGSTDITINADGETSILGKVLIDNSGVTTLNYNADAEAITDKVGQSSKADFTITNSSEVRVNVGEYVQASSEITATKASFVNLTVASGLNASDGQETTYSGTLTANSASSMTVDAQGKLDNATITSSSLESLELTSKSGSSVTLDTENLVSLNVTSSNGLTISSSEESSSNLSSVEEAIIVAETGTFTSTTGMSRIANLNLSGGDATSKVVLGNLGTSTMDYNMNIEATGLQGGLNIGNIEAGEGRDIDINVSGVTGATMLGDIGNADMGNINLTASNTFADLTVGNITSAEDVKIDLSDNLGQIKLGEIKGDNVDVDISGTLKAVALDGDGSDIIVGSSLSYTGSNVVANSVDISLSGTKVDVELNGGSKDDEFTIDDDSVDGAVELKLSGDLGDSETSLDLDNIDANADADDLKKGDLVGIKLDNGANHTVDVSAVKNATIGIDLGDGDDKVTTANEGITVVSAGTGADKITLGDGLDAIVLSSNSTNTINGFKGGEGLTSDLLVFNDDEVTLEGGGKDSLYTMFASSSSDETKADLETYRAIIVTDDTDSDWGNLDTILSSAVNYDDTDTDDDDATIFIVDNGTDARVYLYQDTDNDNTIDYDDLTILATLTGVNTEDLFVDDILV